MAIIFGGSKLMAIMLKNCGTQHQTQKGFKRMALTNSMTGMKYHEVDVDPITTMSREGDNKYRSL